MRLGTQLSPLQGNDNGIKLSGHKFITRRKLFPLGISCFGSLRHKKPTLVKSNADGLDLIGFNIVSPTTLHYWSRSKNLTETLFWSTKFTKLWMLFPEDLKPQLKGGEKT
jgi:hypothetical protein